MRSCPFTRPPPLPLPALESRTLASCVLVLIGLGLPRVAIADVSPSGLILPPAVARTGRIAPPMAPPPALALRPGPATPTQINPQPVPLAMTPSNPGQLCRQAVNAAGHAAGVPSHLMAAIARVESGRRGPDGTTNPWPWSINAEGVDHIYDTREQAVAAVRTLQSQGMRSIDVGCMQVNLMHHPKAFSSLDQAFDPYTNATYAAQFLTTLFAQTGSWSRATAAYHSATPEIGDPYQRKVMAVLGEETQSDNRLLGLQPFPTQRLASLMPGEGTGAVMLGNRSEAAHIIPRAAGSQPRGLDAYRARPVRIAGQGS